MCHVRYKDRISTKLYHLVAHFSRYKGAKKLTKHGRISNIVGEYAKHLTGKYYDGELLAASHKSADVKVTHNNTEVLYQVKTIKLKKLTSFQLGIIRSWDFDFLVVIIFDLNGILLKVLEVPVTIAQEYAKENDHQNGWVITTTQDFLNHSNSKDITELI